MKDDVSLQDSLAVKINDSGEFPHDGLSFLLDGEDDDLDIDSLIPEPKKSRKKSTGDNGRSSLLSAMPKVEWWATRRVLYVTECACKNCGKVYSMPSAHALTEFKTSDGTKTWAKQQIPDDPTMGIEIETIPGGALSVCPECLPATES